MFKYDDFIDKTGEVKELSNEDWEKIENKICSRIFDSFHVYFGWKDKSELKFNRIVTLNENEKFIEIMENKNTKPFKIILKVNRLSDNDSIRLLYNG